MKILPIGKQDFAKLISEDYLYVDKTEHLHRLISAGSVYFLSRPRRFGKSLTLSTLKEIFSGNKELFKGLWIYDKIKWEKYPIIHLDFSKMGVKELGVETAILYALDEIANESGIVLNHKTPGKKFEELLKKFSGNMQVVILIDEYDKPIIDYIENIPKAEENREILKNFYSVLKGNDAHIKFLFITGVSKFSKVSIFSDLNHLDDITLNENYACLTGYTENELTVYFKEYLQLAQNKLGKYFPDITEAIKNWYNGYSWNGADFVYNPFSILNFFSKNQFKDYWFETGTPTFLMKLIKERNYEIIELSGKIVDTALFDKYDLSNLELTALLFQTGYLTIKSYDVLHETYTLDYPNKEVRKSFENYLFSTFTEKHVANNRKFLNDITQSLSNNDIEKFIHLLKILFKGITYPLIDNKENYYHSIFYLVVKLLGFDIETEILACDGRIDSVIKCNSFIYVIEFKLGTAQSALEQIQKKQYHLKYQNQGKQIVLLGIGFDTEQKNIGDYLVQIF
ncbi:MAG: ATP-binding protein [Bacteroidia bacterium]|nr:ATP-binding protein [Bacteroidia bacterium]